MIQTRHPPVSFQKYLTASRPGKKRWRTNCQLGKPENLRNKKHLGHFRYFHRKGRASGTSSDRSCEKKQLLYEAFFPVISPLGVVSVNYLKRIFLITDKGLKEG